MLRFTIRDVLWLTVVVAIGAAWVLDRNQLTTRLAKVEQAAADHQAQRLRAETWAQIGAVEHNKLLRVIMESGQTIVGHADGTTTLEKTETVQTSPNGNRSGMGG